MLPTSHLYLQIMQIMMILNCLQITMIMMMRRRRIMIIMMIMLEMSKQGFTQLKLMTKPALEENFAEHLTRSCLEKVLCCQESRGQTV